MITASGKYEEVQSFNFSWLSPQGFTHIEKRDIHDFHRFPKPVPKYEELDGSQYGFAGLWESWKEANGTLLETSTIIAIDPNEIMEPLHDQMPVIIEPKGYDRWLHPVEAQALPVDLLMPFPSENIRAWKANSRVGNVRNDEEALLVCDDANTLWG